LFIKQIMDAGSDYACVQCGSTDGISIDHIRPISCGGGNDLENLQFLCRRCNSKKGAK
jgi:5-methylcytosine-specific restriction endonuclease McrA